MNEWTGTEIEPPAEQSRKASGEKAFAEGSANAILAKGGPLGAYLWAHLHAVHDGRQGESHYTVSVLVTDEDEYPWLLTPILKKSVEGVLDKPERHKHYYGTFIAEEGLNATGLEKKLNEGKSFTVRIVGTRKRDDWEWVFGELKDIFSDIADVSEDLVKQYVSGAINPSEMLKALQNGRVPVGV